MISNWWGRFRLDVHLTTIDILEDHLATDHEIDNWTWVNIFAEIFFMPSYTNSMGIFRNLWKYFKYVSSGWVVVPGHCRDPGPGQKRGIVSSRLLPIPAFTNRIYEKILRHRKVTIWIKIQPADFIDLKHVILRHVFWGYTSSRIWIYHCLWLVGLFKPPEPHYRSSLVLDASKNFSQPKI